MAAHMTDDDRLLAARLLSRSGTPSARTDAFNGMVLAHFGAAWKSVANYWRYALRVSQGDHTEETARALGVWAHELVVRRRAFAVVCHERGIDGDDLTRYCNAEEILMAANEAEAAANEVLKMLEGTDNNRYSVEAYAAEYRAHLLARN